LALLIGATFEPPPHLPRIQDMQHTKGRIGMDIPLSAPVQDVVYTLDEAGLEALREQYGAQLLRFVERIVQDALVAEDVVQDAFWSLYQNAARVDPARGAAAYLYGIARNRAYDHLRQRARNAQVSLDDEPMQDYVSATVASDDPDTEEAVHWLLLNLQVREAMERLPDAQRQALLLYAEGGLSYNEVAEQLDISVGTVKSRIYHAKRLLRALLDPQAVLELDTAFGNNASGKS
jgi:RNA polymerase sigma-70 factor, ECF subfamily